MNNLTLMAHLEIGRKNSELLMIAGELANTMNARVIGIAACQPMQMAFGDGYLSGDFIEKDKEELAQQMVETEAEFYKVLKSQVSEITWRSTMLYASIADYVAREARSADIIISAVSSGDLYDAQRKMNLGDLVMQAGRPVLILPENRSQFMLDNVLIGWQDTLEVRRAILLALPFLKKARYVAITEMATESQLPYARTRLADVVAWLSSHDVIAEPLAILSLGNDPVQLQQIAYEQSAHIILAGAYGHSRIRELMFGGITKNLLHPVDCCSLLA